MESIFLRTFLFTISPFRSADTEKLEKSSIFTGTAGQTSSVLVKLDRYEDAEQISVFSFEQTAKAEVRTSSLQELCSMDGIFAKVHRKMYRKGDRKKC